MKDNVPDGVRDAWQRERAEREQCWTQAVEVLTRAARLTRTTAGGQLDPDDFPDFLVSAVAAAAANLGNAETLTAGRPGSWEASLVRQMLTGALGSLPAVSDLLARRTEPIRVPINVAQLVEDSGVIPTLLEAEDAHKGTGNIDEDAVQLDALYDRYCEAYRRYAETFAREAQAYALTLEGLAVENAVGEGATLRVPVIVITETDPYEAWNHVENPEEFQDDEVVRRIWEGAVERAGLPALGESV